MKVSVNFTEGGLTLRLTAENEVEQRMVGAVLLGDSWAGATEICAECVQAQFTYDGHFSNRKIKAMDVRLLKAQTAPRPTSSTPQN